jgi:hypothetical protein
MSQKPNLEALVLTLETETLITQVLTPSISKVQISVIFFNDFWDPKNWQILFF